MIVLCFGKLRPALSQDSGQFLRAVSDETAGADVMACYLWVS